MINIIFDYIKLKNYRQYQDEKITFPDYDEEKRFSIIKGTTGAGKTNILNAINWCLYGTEPHLGIKTTEFPVANTFTLDQLEKGETCKVIVELQFSGEFESQQIGRKTNLIKVKRQANYKKTRSGDVEKVPLPNTNTPDGSRQVVLKEGRRGMSKINRHSINALIPPNLSDYFFFDGEKLNEYFTQSTTSAAEEVKKAVKRISQIDKLEDTIKHLDETRKEIRKEVEKISPDIKNKNKKIEKIEDEIEKAEEKKDKLKKDKDEAKEKEREFEGKLRNYEDIDIQDLQNERDQLKNKKDKLINRLEKKENKRRNFIIQTAPSCLVLPQLLKAYEELQKKEDSGKIPPDYKPGFLERLLEFEEECICGSTISKKKASENPEVQERREALKKELEESDKISDLSEKLTELRSSLVGIIKRKTKGTIDRLSSFKNDIEGLENDINEIDKRLDEIGGLLEGKPEDKIKRWEEKRKSYKQEKEDLKRKIWEKEDEIDRLDDQKSSLESELKGALRKKKEAEDLNQKLDFVKTAKNFAIETKKDIMEEIKSSIESKTSEYFLDLIWKEENYKGVEMKDNYQISAIDQFNRDATGILSAGERQGLALAFMAALNEVSGFKVPIVIDTPMGRLDEGTPKEKLAERLPIYLEGRQIIMLVTGSEYTQPVREKILPYLGKEYEIEFEETPHGNKAEVKRND